MQYEIHRDHGGQFHRRLVDPDGATVALAATTFASAENARHGAVDVQRHAASATGPGGSPVGDGRPDALHAQVDDDEVNVVPDEPSGGWLLNTAEAAPMPAWYGTAGEAEHAARGYAAAHGARYVYLHDRYHRVRAVATHPPRATPSTAQRSLGSKPVVTLRPTRITRGRTAEHVSRT